MNLEKANYFKNNAISLFVSANDEFAFVPNDISRDFEKKISDCLDVEVIKCSIAGSNLLGVLCKLFSKKIVLSKIATEKDIDFFNSLGFKTFVFDNYYAVGNIIANIDNKIIYGENFSDSMSDLKSFLATESLSIKNNLAGSLLLGNKKAFAVSPLISEKDYIKINSFLGKESAFITVNRGDSFISSGIIINNKGLIIGDSTSNYEMLRINELFID